MFMSHQQDARQNHITKINNKPSDNVEKFKYLGKITKTSRLDGRLPVCHESRTLFTYWCTERAKLGATRCAVPTGDLSVSTCTASSFSCQVRNTCACFGCRFLIACTQYTLPQPVTSQVIHCYPSHNHENLHLCLFFGLHD